MKLSKTTWLILGIGIFVIAAFIMFQSYQKGVEERDKVENSLSEAQAALSTAITEKGSAELELTQTEEELQEMQNELSQLETELTQAELTLDRAEAKFPGSVESIEYDELLFSLAADANLKITSLSTSKAAETDINGIAYTTTDFTMNVQGEVADILDFINRIVTEEDLNTAVLESVTITVPEPLTETEKEEIKGGVAAAEIDRLITEVIEGLPEQESWTQEDIDKIVMALEEALDEIKGLTAPEIEELTASEIETLITEAIEGLPEQENWTQEDIDKIVMALEEALDEIKGLTVAEIAELAAKKIEEAEMPSAAIKLTVYSYEGE